MTNLQLKIIHILVGWCQYLLLKLQDRRFTLIERELDRIEAIK